MYSHFILPHLPVTKSYVERDNVNVHRAAAKIIVFKSRAARGSVCNVLLSRHSLNVMFRKHSRDCRLFVNVVGPVVKNGFTDICSISRIGTTRYQHVQHLCIAVLYAAVNRIVINFGLCVWVRTVVE